MSARSSSTSQRTAKISAVFALLYERFPRTFFADPKKKRQLKVGILKDLIEVLGDSVHRHYLQTALKYYASGFTYLKQQRAGAERVDLNGTVVGKVTKEEEERARSVLDKIEANRKRRKRQKDEHYTERQNAEQQKRNALEASLKKLREAALRRSEGSAA